MAEEKIKAKYKIGQKVYYISNGGWVACDAITCILFKDGEARYSFKEPKYQAEKYEVDWEDVYFDHSLHPTKESLIKEIKETNYEDD